MKRTIVLSLLLLSFFSCKKEDSITLNEYLTGGWQLVKIGADINNNQTLEENELVPLPDSLIAMNFHSNGTGNGGFLFGDTSVSAPFAWTTNDRQETLTMTALTGAYELHIKALNYSSFYVINDNLKVLGGKLGMVFKRR
ncbi:MAG TPA: hypothetical protein VL093_03700 [Flavipsychrobacter sp.]|nr:hypothetical protein [Flavipsychrobacter sp.]